MDFEGSPEKKTGKGRVSLSKTEAEELNGILDLFASDTEPRPSLNKFIWRWEHLVAQVVRGYDDSIYEYTNDLAVRDRLDQILFQSGVPLRSKIAQAIEPTDRLFFDATRESTGLTDPLFSPKRWWSRRVPISPGPELASDIEARDL